MKDKSVSLVVTTVTAPNNILYSKRLTKDTWKDERYLKNLRRQLYNLALKKVRVGTQLQVFIQIKNKKENYEKAVDFSPKRPDAVPYLTGPEEVPRNTKDRANRYESRATFA